MDIWDSSKKKKTRQATTAFGKPGINKIQNETSLSSALNVKLIPPGTNAVCFFFLKVFILPSTLCRKQYEFAMIQSRSPILKWALDSPPQYHVWLYKLIFVSWSLLSGTLCMYHFPATIIIFFSSFFSSKLRCVFVPSFLRYKICPLGS